LVPERPLLQVDQLEVRYGAIVALRGISFGVMPGQVVTLIGANGAGKSTTLNTISSLIPAFSGEIMFNDTPVTRWNPARVARFGLVQVPEGRQVIAPMSMQENLEMGQMVAQHPFWHFLPQPEGRVKARQDSHVELEAIFARFPRLEERRHQKAGSLSGGEQQMLAVRRALLAKPRLLCSMSQAWDSRLC
jgi:branched-chain amino acid transport system ATP-binding protein